MLEPKDIIPIVISAVALAISVLSFVLTQMYRHKSHAPLLYIDELKLTMLGYHENKKPIKWLFDLSIDDPITHNDCFILDNRYFIKNTRLYPPYEQEEPKALNSLIFNTCSQVYPQRDGYPNYSQDDKESNPREWVAFSSHTLRNIGYDLIKIEIEKIEIFFEPDIPPKKLLPGDQANTLHVYLANNACTEIHLSFLFEDGNQHALLKDRQYFGENIKKIEKLDTVKNNILNAYVPVMMDRYQSIKYYLITTNKDGKKYKQTITFDVSNGRYACTSQMGYH